MQGAPRQHAPVREYKREMPHSGSTHSKAESSLHHVWLLLL